MYPLDTKFQLDLPITITDVKGVGIRHFKYIPEYVVNSRNRTFSVSKSGVVTSITLDKGDYRNASGDPDVQTLLTALNAKLTSSGVQFVLSSGLVNLQFIGGSSFDYLAIPNCNLLNILGFTNGIALYTSVQPSVANTTNFQSVAIAQQAANVTQDSSLVMKIRDIEAISSCDSVCNRATAILLSSRTKDAIVEQSQNYIQPLLQVQARIQSLRVEFTNVDGEPYDFGGESACFTLELECNNCVKWQ